MGNRTGPRNIGPEKYLAAWLTADGVELYEACLKEASRQITEMKNWMDEQVTYDPQGMLWEYEESIIPLIKKAIKYRYKIYNVAKKRKELEEKSLLLVAQKYSGNGQDPRLRSDKVYLALNEEFLDLEQEQMGYVWRIKKIHATVRKLVRLDLAPGEVDPFAEYEYDPAKS